MAAEGKVGLMAAEGKVGLMMNVPPTLGQSLDLDAQHGPY